jgi:glyoxylase I family protein
LLRDRRPAFISARILSYVRVKPEDDKRQRLTGYITVMKLQIQSLTPLLMVYDMRRSVAFYRDVLGFEVLEDWEPDGHLYWAMLKLGDAVLMLNADYEDDKRPPEPGPLIEHKLTLYFACRDVDAAYAQLRDLRCDAKEPVNTHYGMRQVFLRDPDGFSLCLQQRVI